MKILNLQGSPQTIKINISFEVKLKSWDKLLEQFANSFKTLIKQLIQECINQFIQQIFMQIKEQNSELRFYKGKTRKLFTLGGEMTVPDFELRWQGGKYVGRSTNILLGMIKNSHVVSGVSEIFKHLLSKLSYRKSGKILKCFWDKFSAQRLHYAVKHDKEAKDSLIVKFQRLSKKLRKRILVFLDGNILNIKDSKKMPVEKRTLRVVVKEKIWAKTKETRIAFGFLDCSYYNLLERVISSKEKQEDNIVAISDGERKIISDVIKFGIKHFQMCVWHFLENLKNKLIAGGVDKESAEQYKKDIRNIVYVRKKYLNKIGGYWRTLTRERTKLFMDHIECMENDGLIKVAGYMKRMLPYLFTYIRMFCAVSYRIWIGRTGNKIERLNRALTYRLKRIGAVWSEDGAKRITNYVLSDYLNSYPAPGQPCNITMNKTVVKI